MKAAGTRGATVASATPNYGFIKPDTGDQGWGDTVNSDLDAIDVAIHGIAASAGIVTSVDGLTGAVLLSDRYVAHVTGTHGDGITDDKATIQAALDAASPGQIVQLPIGVFALSDRLVIPPGVTLQGQQGRRVDNIALATEVPTLSYLKPLASFSGDACLRMLDKEEGGYSADNNGQRIRRIAIDLSAVGGSTVDGIKATGYVHDVLLENVSIYGAPHNGVTSSSYTRLDTTSWHPYSWTVINCIVQAASNIGWSLGSNTDTWMELVQAIGCGSHGFFLSSMPNSQFIGLRSEFNLDGYRITGSWGTGTGSGGGIWNGCSTDRNTNYGFHIDATGSAPLQFNSPMCRRDGRQGGSGGGNFAGFFGDNSTCPIVVTNPVVFPGVDDDGSGTNSPQIGIKASGCTFFSFNGGYVHAQTTAISDDGTNTAFLQGPGTGTATGSTAAPTRATAIGWTPTYTVNDRQLIKASNTGTQINAPMIDLTGSTATSRMLGSQVSGDSVRRWNIGADGSMSWGDGTITRDTTLYRSAADTLKTDDSLIIATPGRAANSAQVVAKTGIAKITAGTQQWGIPNTSFTTGGTTALVINEDRYVPFRVDYPLTMSAWQVEVTAAPASNANIRIGVYLANTDMQPAAATAPAYDSGAVAVASGFTGIKTATGLSVVLVPGMYLAAINCDVVMTLRTVVGPSFIVNAALGATPLVQRVSVARSFAAFPTPGQQWTAINAVAAGSQHFVVWQWTDT